MTAASVRTPPLEPVRGLQAALIAGGVPCVVGGSALVAARGLVDHVNDWDLVVDAGRAVDTTRIIGELGLTVRETRDAHPPFETELLIAVDAGDHDIDVMVGFAVRGPDGERVDVSTRAEPGAFGGWQGLRLGRADEWARAYTAMGREARAALLTE
ncbi:MAG: hypothetical protein ACXIUP_03015 [Microcella sp.]